MASLPDLGDLVSERGVGVSLRFRSVSLVMASEGESGSSSQSRVSGGRRDGKAPIYDLLKRLELHEEEDDNLNFDEELPDVVPEAEFRAICCMHTTRPYSRESCYTTMRMAWSLAQDVNFKPVGENMFVLTMNCLGDCKRVTEQVRGFFF